MPRYLQYPHNKYGVYDGQSKNNETIQDILMTNVHRMALMTYKHGDDWGMVYGPITHIVVRPIPPSTLQCGAPKR